MKKGIEQIKTAILTAAKFANKLDEALEDKKISFLESIGMISIISGLSNVVESWPEILAEIQDLDASEVAELEEAFRNEFDLRNDQLEGKIESVVIFLSSIDNLRRSLKKVA